MDVGQTHPEHQQQQEQGHGLAGRQVAAAREEEAGAGPGAGEARGQRGGAAAEQLKPQDPEALALAAEQLKPQDPEALALALALLDRAVSATAGWSLESLELLYTRAAAVVLEHAGCRDRRQVVATLEEALAGALVTGGGGGGANVRSRR